MITRQKKKAEAEYNYKIYLAEGETAEETYNATIKKLEKEISDIEEKSKKLELKQNV